MVKKILKNKELSLLILFATIIPITSIALTYGAFKTSRKVETLSKGIIGDTVYIDDSDSDYYYYTGQNYTSNNGTIPTAIDKNIYNDSNLVRTTITYNGSNKDGTKTGYVSLDELQSKYIYYKYYPVVDNYIEIPLIDNPFSYRPDDLVFNGWISDYKGAVISYDDETYQRTIKVPVTSNQIEINLYANWTEGKVVNVNNSNSINNAMSSINAKTMNKVETVVNIYEYPSIVGYYKQLDLVTTTVVSNWGSDKTTTKGTCTNCYTSQGRYYQNYSCPAPNLGWWANDGTYTNNCTMYEKQDANSSFDLNAKYFTYQNGSMQNANLQATIVGTKENDNYKETTNMSGYYRKKDINYGESLTGYYNEQGEKQSGTCRTGTVCSVYELIQYYKENGDEELFNKDETYYYLTTRDTNILVMTGNYSDSWSSDSTKPFTLTGINNGKDYNPTWTVSSTSVIAYSDIRIENLTIVTRNGYSNSTPTYSNNTQGAFYGNYHNVKIGRNIKKSGNYVNFLYIFGAMNPRNNWDNSTVGSASSPKKYHLIVESGSYNATSSTYGGNTGTGGTVLYTEMTTTYGNDYDRAKEDNSKLTVYFCAAGSWGGVIHSSNDDLVPALNTIVKSGSFGTSKYDISTGIYIGARYGGTHYAPRSGKIEGGYIYNLIGGPITSSNRGSKNDTFIYMTGGEVDFLTGGAGTSTTYGNRIIQVTGGVVNYSVFGGSNGYNGSSEDGTLTGSSYVYIGGNATIGNDTYIANNRTLFGAESGSVFGAGNGNTSYATIGSVNNSTVIVNDNAIIKKSVYGSGNYGTVGYSSSSNGNVLIKINGGTIGNVFGSGNNSGSGREWNVNIDTSIEMTNGTITGGIYGGSNQKGSLYGSVTLNILGGEVNEVYGGGLGSETYVTNNVLVNLGDETNTLNLVGKAYGGSAFGTVNSKQKTNTISNYKTEVNVNGGNINNVFGGGKGDSNNTPYVAGNVTLTINNGTVTNAFGGDDAKGKPNGEVKVYLNGGVITKAFGGGNKTAVDNTYVYQIGSKSETIYGGSNEQGEVSTANIEVTGGEATTIYGGNNIGGKTKTTNITVSAGKVGTIYGGGALTDTTTTNVTVSNGEIDTIYGGGEQASIEDKTLITIDSGTINNIYGGSNINGSVIKSYIDINGGVVGEVYGGNNQGGLTTTTNVNLNSGTITTTYGGGNKTETTTSNVKLNGSTASNIFGGGNNAGVTTTNVNLITGSATNVYGGSNQKGSVDTSKIISTSPVNLTVQNIYGGNNQGGNTKTTNINLTGGVYQNLFGGGNMAQTDNTNVTVNGITMTGKFYGGGNQADVNYSTKVDFISSSIEEDLFGGGNLGRVEGNTEVYISASTIKGSAYAGGNGTTAVVSGNTTLSIDNSSLINKHVFGGGNAANTGEKDNTKSISTLNIAGATINGNVYGGANTAILYGKTIVNIGYNQTNFNQTDITIGGTIFGGGEANASGNPNYDYSFISVTEGITINIDANNYKNFNIYGSIFGSGNASSTKGYSYINISNYGTFNNYKENISIQRTDKVTIKNSSIHLSGTTDRTNEYSTTKFSISRVKELKLANDSTLFLDNGTNLLEKFTSLKMTGSQEEVATVGINDKKVTRNVNNRVYMLENKNLNIATNEAVTSYGTVSGMTFFGMYQLDRNNKVSTAFYNNKYNSGDTVASGEFYSFTAGSYVLGSHNTNHDITKDGFYSNYEDKEKEGTIEVKYIEPTPSDASYYMWVIGEKVTTYEFSLTASKYSTLGTYELPLVASNGANTIFEIIGFNYQNLEEGFNLVDPSKVERVNKNGTADDKMALSMEASNTGFVTKGTTGFQTNATTPIVGTKDYETENSSIVPSLIFYLYHSKNITKKREMGTVIISLLAIKPIDDLNNEVTRININVTLNSALYSDNDYEGAMTAGEKYSLFASTATNITTKSTLSAYYSLYMKSNKNYYQDGYHHALVSNYVLPINTKLTMIDLATNTYYYYVVTTTDLAKKEEEYNRYGECSYELSDFVKMGSTSKDNNFDETKSRTNYYKSDLKVVDEEFIFNVDFEDTDITTDQTNKTLLMELRDKNNQTLISVLGIQHSSLTYNLYNKQKATIDLSGELSANNIYLKDKVNLSLTANFTQPIVNSLPVTDTTYFNKKMGVKITIYDSEHKKLNNSSLFGLSYQYNGKTYYPRMDGSVRIPLKDKVANIFSKIKIDTSNLNLSSGDYTLKVESFGSYDGIYYGPESSSSIELPFKIVDSVYGLNVKLDDNQVIIDKATGLTSKDDNSLDFTTNYSSNLANPNIRVTLYRRTYNDVYDTTYEKVDLAKLVTNKLDLIKEQEYMFIDDPNTVATKTLYLRTSLRSGTYRFEFSLYDNDNYIGNSYTYIIVK